MLGQIHLTWDFLIGFLSIIIVNLVLSGDNAFVIAMAVRSLPGKQRMNGIVIGVGAAIVLRVVLTFSLPCSCRSNMSSLSAAPLSSGLP